MAGYHKILLFRGRDQKSLLKQMTEEAVLIDNVKISYITGGIGPCILVLHGWGGSLESWRSVGNVLAESGYKVVILDLPGFGKSDYPPSDWSVFDYLDFILKFIEKLKSLKIISEPFFLLGHSFGGRIAIKFAAFHPEKLKKMILCSAAGIVSEKKAKIKIINFLAKLGRKIFFLNYSWPVSNFFKRVVYYFAESHDYLKANAVMKKVMQRVLSENLSDCFSKIKTPTLIIWGEKDKILSVKEAYLMNKKISGSKLEIFQGVGHAPNLEIPEKLAESILNWCIKAE